MDSPQALKTVTIKRWLPYWAVFQADARQTVHSWVYRAWVLVSVLSAVGYLLYRVGVSDLDVVSRLPGMVVRR